MFNVSSALKSSFSDTYSLLFRHVMLYIGVDAVFSGYVYANAYLVGGVWGILAGIFLQQLFSACGYMITMYRMRLGEDRALRLQRLGVRGMFGVLLFVGGLSICLPESIGGFSRAWITAGLLSALGGWFRGVAWCSRTWLELHHTEGDARKIYLARVESFGTFIRLAIPLMSAGILLYFHEQLAPVFIFTAFVGAAACFALQRGQLLAPCPPALRPWSPWFAPGYWKTGPFYIIEGLSHAVRSILYTSGALTVVGRISSYSLVDATAAGAAALYLFWQSRHPQRVQPLRLLTMGLVASGIAWAALIGSLHFVWLLPVFVMAYALSQPWISASKSAYTLKTLAGGASHNNAIARNWLLTLARMASLGISGLLCWAAPSSTVALVAIAVYAMVLLPLDWWYARALG